MEYEYDVEEEVDDDEIEGTNNRLPLGTFKLRPSGFRLPPTVYVDYPSDLNMLRTDVGYLEELGHRILNYKCSWERNCIKNAFHRAGFSNSESMYLLVIVL